MIRPNPLVLLALLLPFDALMGGAAGVPLALAAAALCAAQGALLPADHAGPLPPALAEGARRIRLRLRHPAVALLETVGVVAAALLLPAGAALLLVSAALFALDARLRLAARA